MRIGRLQPFEQKSQRSGDAAEGMVCRSSRCQKRFLLADVTKAYVQPFIVNHQCIICHTKLGSHLHSIKRHIERGHPVLANEIRVLFDIKQVPIIKDFDLADPKYNFRHNTSVTPKSYSEVRHPRITKRPPPALSPVVAVQTTEQGIQAMDDLIKTFLTSSVPLLSLGNPHFMGLMNLIEGFTPPTITQFTGILKSHVQMAINLAVTEIILSDLHYSISVDVSNESYSTKKFMGIALHYYSEVSNEVKTIAIDLKKCHLTGSLQVCDVVKHLLADLKLPPNRLVRIVAGSGRMKKAVFRHVDPEDDENDVESSDDEDEEMDGSNTDQVMESINNVLGNSRNSAQMEPVEDGCVNVALLGDLDLDRYIQLLEKSEGAGNKDPGFIGDHFTCAVYRLQQVCEAVFDRCEAMVVMRDNVQKLLTAFARSPEAMSRLRSENGASLNFPANNQWATMEKVFSRIIDIREALHTVCTEQFRVSYINSDDVRLMEIAVAFLRPFNQYMTVLQRSSVPTLPLLFTGLSHLIVTLEGTPSKLDLPPRGIAFDVNSLMTALCTEIKTQFADVLSPGPDSDPIFIAASALDATVASFLLAHVNLTAVREAVIKCIKIFQLGSPESTPEVEVKPAVVNPFGFGPSIQVNKPPAMENTAEKEVEYLIYLIQNKQWNCANPFDLFDTYNLTTLKQLAFVLASVPATSAAVDRLFTKMSDIDIDLSNKTEASIFKIRCIGGFNMQV